jgi:hypothetical protein
MASVLARPKYGNSELGDILMQQYPPLFHAATNVPSFINALKHLPNMRHLTIRTPGQNPKERYRRDIVDYALISLRISIERTSLPQLCKLSLSSVHPSAFTYLRPISSLGALPSSTRRWRQIRKLHISVESWDFYGPCPGLDHLKMIDDYIRVLGPNLQKFSFTWLGRKGPCPLALTADPLFAPPRNSKKLFAEVTSPMSPLPPRPARRPLLLPRVRFLQVRNATMNEVQVRDLVAAHKRSVREFDFDNVALINNGSWDIALEPLTDARSDVWSRHSIGASESSFRPAPVARTRSGSGSAVVSSVEEDLPSPSAAAAAASKELFEVDLDGMVFGGANDVEVLEAGVHQWREGVMAAQDGSTSERMPSVAEVDEEEAEEILAIQTASQVAVEATPVEEVDDGGLASDIEAAKQASLAFNTKLKKHRIRKKRSHRHHRRDGAESEAAGETADEGRRSSERNHHRHHSRSRHKHTRSDETFDRPRDRDRDRERDRDRDRERDRSKDRDRDHSRHRSRSRSRHRRRRHHRRHHSAEPELPRMPDNFIAEVLPSDDESVVRQRRPPSTPQPDANISAPILSPDPLPVMLQPHKYDPSATAGPFVSCSRDDLRMPTLARTSSNRSVASKAASSRLSGTLPDTQQQQDDDRLTSVQLSVEAEMRRAEAEEAAARSSALKKAREAVLARLGREFCRRKGASQQPERPCKRDSPAVMGLAAMSNVELGTTCSRGAAASPGDGVGGGARFAAGLLRDGLFGRSVANVNYLPTTSASMYGRQDHRSLESQSALVPLIFSRS